MIGWVLWQSNKILDPCHLGRFLSCMSVGLQSGGGNNVYSKSKGSFYSYFTQQSSEARVEKKKYHNEYINN